MIPFTRRNAWTALIAATALTIVGTTAIVAQDEPNQTYGRVGTTADLLPIDEFCGTEPVKVGIADGFGGNSWRKITRAEAELRIAAQMPSSEKRRYADYEIDTSGTFDQTRERVREVYKDLLRSSKADFV